MSEGVKLAWSQEDERFLQEMLERKRVSEQATRDCVYRAVKDWFYYNMDNGDIAEALINDATKMRKVLEPFDRELK